MPRFMSRCRFYARAWGFISAICGARALLVLSALLAVTPPAGAQAIYPTPDAAANAFVNALAASDEDSMKHVLGPNYRQLIPAQDVGQDDIYDFLGAWAHGHNIVLEEGPQKGRQTARVRGRQQCLDVADSARANLARLAFRYSGSNGRTSHAPAWSQRASRHDVIVGVSGRAERLPCFNRSLRPASCQHAGPA